jgi:octaprenyl-diphosphate synthase
LFAVHSTLNKVREALKHKELIAPFKTEFDKFEETFAEIMQSNVPLIDTVAKYMMKSKGKNLRPLLVLMSSKLCGELTPHSYVAASVVELLHSATLVHDDVVDDSDLRRGFPSIKAKWKNKVAVLMGDYLLSKSLIGASETDNIDVIRILSNAAKRLTRGELLQLQKSRNLDMTELEYLEMIGDKTAALLSACSELGAVTTNATKEQREALRKFGEYLGIAFQIKDDLLDYQSKATIIGKPAGADLKEQKLTLPIIYALAQSSDSERKSILKQVKKSMKRSDISAIIQFVTERGGLTYAEEQAEHYATMARNELNIFSNEETKQHIFNFVNYAISRKK